MISVRRLNSGLRMAGCRAEHSELGGLVGFLVEVLFVGHPAQEGTDQRSDELAAEVGHHRAEVHGGLSLGDVIDEQTDGDCRVQVATGLGGGDDTHEHREAPPPVHEQKTCSLSLGLGQRGVGDHAAAEEDQQHRTDCFRQEDGEHL